MKEKTIYTIEILKLRAWYKFPWTVWIHKNGKCLDCQLTWTKSGAKRWVNRRVSNSSRNEIYKIEV